MKTQRVRANITGLPDPELVELALAKWGGPVEVFADQIIGVAPVTLRRWRKGESRLTRRRRQWFERYISPPPFTRERSA